MALILVTVPEASEHFGMHRATLYRWVKDKKLGVVKLRGKRYLIYDEVERLMEQRR
jgi:excisionase family DNA binding protein